MYLFVIDFRFLIFLELWSLELFKFWYHLMETSLRLTSRRWTIQTNFKSI